MENDIIADASVTGRTHYPSSLAADCRAPRVGTLNASARQSVGSDAALIVKLITLSGSVNGQQCDRPVLIDGGATPISWIRHSSTSII